MEEHKTVSKGLSWAFFLNLLFAIIELIGGFLTNSTAIITDAFHDFMDAAAIGVAVYMDKYSKKKASKSFTFGYRRFALLSAIILSAILLIGAAFMIYHAITSFHITKQVNSLGMLALAVLGIAINGLAFLRIKNDDEPHEHHNHSHHHHSKDANSKAVMLHLLEDVLGWIAVLIGSIIMHFTKWFWIDTLLTLFIALFISYNAIKNLWSTFRILLQAVPENISVDEMEQKLITIDGIVEIVSLKIWSIDGIEHVANIHLKINDLKNHLNIQNQIKNILEKEFNIKELTIQLE